MHDAALQGGDEEGRAERLSVQRVIAYASLINLSLFSCLCAAIHEDTPGHRSHSAVHAVMLNTLAHNSGSMAVQACVYLSRNVMCFTVFV